MTIKDIENKHVLTAEDIMIVCNLKKSTAYSFVKEMYNRNPQPFPIHKICGQYRIPADEFFVWFHYNRQTTE